MLAPTKRVDHPKFIDTSRKPPYAVSKIIQEEHKAGIYVVKFCPFVKENIFAVSSDAQVTVYQCSEDEKDITKRAFFQAEKGVEEQFYSFNWVCHKPKHGKSAIYLVIGNHKGLIRSIDPFATVGTPVCRFIGHTKAVNQIAVHPTFSSIFASASADKTIRIWHCLSDVPFAVLYFTQQQALTVDFHQTGNYLVSGGMDHAIRVWNLGKSAELTKKLEYARNGIFNKEETIEFSECDAEAKDIHGDFVDCVRFIGNYILSKSPESYITLFKFGHFNDPSPCGQQPPYDTFETALFKVADLYVPQCNNWFIRFDYILGLEHGESWLACGNDGKGIALWDLRARPLPIKRHYLLFDYKFPMIIRNVAFNHDGTIMIAVGSNGTICRLDKVPGFKRSHADVEENE